MFKEGDNYQEVFVVTEEVYYAFQTVSRDMNPLHTDEEFAKAKGFHGRVMYGNILNGFISYFIGMSLPTKDVIIHSQEISYTKPVYLNDLLLLKAEVTGVYESVNAVTFKFKFLNQENKTVSKGKFQVGLL